MQEVASKLQALEAKEMVLDVELFKTATEHQLALEDVAEREQAQRQATEKLHKARKELARKEAEVEAKQRDLERHQQLLTATILGTLTQKPEAQMDLMDFREQFEIK